MYVCMFRNCLTYKFRYVFLQWNSHTSIFLTTFLSCTFEGFGVKRI